MKSRREKRSLKPREIWALRSNHSAAGAKACGKCKIKLEEGSFDRHGITSSSRNLSPFTAEEEKFIGDLEKAEGYRLACSAQIKGDVLIFVPEESRAEDQVIRKSASEKQD